MLNVIRLRAFSLYSYVLEPSFMLRILMYIHSSAVVYFGFTLRVNARAIYVLPCKTFDRRG